MTEVQPYLTTKPVIGRRAARTSTAPSLRSSQQKPTLPFSPAKFGDLSKGPLASSHLELVAKRYQALSNRQSGQLSPSEYAAPEVDTFSEVKTVYGMRQTLKDILEHRKGDVPVQRHRREMVRVWSREKITVTETRIYSRPPSRQCSRNASAVGSCTNLNRSVSDKVTREIPVQLTIEDRILDSGIGTKLPNSSVSPVDHQFDSNKPPISIPIKKGSAADSEKYGENLPIDSDLGDTISTHIVEGNFSSNKDVDLNSECFETEDLTCKIPSVVTEPPLAPSSQEVTQSPLNKVSSVLGGNPFPESDDHHESLVQTSAQNVNALNPIISEPEVQLNHPEILLVEPKDIVKEDLNTLNYKEELNPFSKSAIKSEVEIENPATENLILEQRRTPFDESPVSENRESPFNREENLIHAQKEGSYYENLEDEKNPKIQPVIDDTLASTRQALELFPDNIKNVNNSESSPIDYRIEDSLPQSELREVVQAVNSDSFNVSNDPITIDLKPSEDLSGERIQESEIVASKSVLNESSPDAFNYTFNQTISHEVIDNDDEIIFAPAGTASLLSNCAEDFNINTNTNTTQSAALVESSTVSVPESAHELSLAAAAGNTVSNLLTTNTNSSLTPSAVVDTTVSGDGGLVTATSQSVEVDDGIVKAEPAAMTNASSTSVLANNQHLNAGETAQMIPPQTEKEEQAADEWVEQPIYFRTVVRKDETGYGFIISGSNPVKVRNVRPGGTAEKAGIQIGDELIKVNGVPVENTEHNIVVARIKSKTSVCFMLRRFRMVLASEAKESSHGYASESKPRREKSDTQRMHYQKRRAARQEARMLAAERNSELSDPNAHQKPRSKQHGSAGDDHDSRHYAEYYEGVNINHEDGYAPGPDTDNEELIVS